MEAINSLASVATKAIWGDNSPNTNNNNNSGTTTTTAAAPAAGAADVGKDNAPPATAAATKEAKEEPISGVQGDTSKGEPFDAGNMDKDVAAAKVDANASSAAAHDQPSSTAKGDSTKLQSDARKPDDVQEPTAKAADEGEAVDLDSTKLKGPGPRPLEQVARERGGDAGNTAAAGKTDDDATAAAAQVGATKPEDGSEKRTDSNLNEDGEPLGQKHVSSTGVAADGGDFDAANPGAGSEADKILHEKGIHPQSSGDGKAASPSGKSSGTSPDRKGIRGLGHKIKDKLRRGSQS